VQRSADVASAHVVPVLRSHGFARVPPAQVGDTVRRFARPSPDGRDHAVIELCYDRMAIAPARSLVITTGIVLETSCAYYGVLHGLGEPAPCEINYGVELRAAPVPPPWSSSPGGPAREQKTWTSERTDPASTRACGQDLARALTQVILPALIELLDRTALVAELTRVATARAGGPDLDQGAPRPASRLHHQREIDKYLLWACIDDATPEQIEDLLVRYEQNARAAIGLARHSSYIMRRWARAHSGLPLPSPWTTSALSTPRQDSAG